MTNSDSSETPPTLRFRRAFVRRSESSELNTGCATHLKAAWGNYRTHLPDIWISVNGDQLMVFVLAFDFSRNVLLFFRFRLGTVARRDVGCGDPGGNDND